MNDIQNIRISPVEIMLDRPRKFNLTLLGISYLAEKYGTAIKAFNELAKADAENFGKDFIDLISDFMFAGLCWEDDALTVRDVQTMISLENIIGIFQTVVQSVNKALPQRQAAGGAGDPPLES